MGAPAQRGGAGNCCGHGSPSLPTFPYPSPSPEAAGPCVEVHKLSLSCCPSGGEIELGFAAPGLLIITPVAEQGGLMGFPTSRW